MHKNRAVLHTYTMDRMHVLLSVCPKSTVVEAPSTNLDKLMFVHLAFVMQKLQQREERLVVSRQTVFVFVLLSVFVHHLAQPEWLGVTWLL